MRITLLTLRCCLLGARSLGYDLTVAVQPPGSHALSGAVVGIGSRIGVKGEDGRLYEDIEPTWITSFEVIAR